jgi:hypothetical protein
LRQRAGRERAALDRLDQFGEVAMAIVEAARGIGDADDRTIEHLAAVAHRARERAAQIEAEIAVAVVGQAASQAAFGRLLFGHVGVPARRGEVCYSDFRAASPALAS